MGLKTKRFGIISGLLVLMFILVASASAQPPIPTPPLPPYFSDLTVTPSELERGDNVTISVDITNMDSQQITYGVDIHIENVNDPPSTGPPSPELWMRIWVELDAYESTSVSRTLTPETVGDYNVTVNGLTGSFTVGTWPPLRPAEFVVTGLMFRESEVEVGEENTITIAIENVGEQSGNYTVTMRLENGPIIMVEEKEITLEGGWLKIVPFNFTLDVEGTYQVVVDGLTGSFTVKEPKKPFEVIVDDFQVHPFAIEVEDEDDVWTFRVSVNVANVGELEGNHTVELKIDGSVVDSRTLTLAEGEDTTVLFEVERGIGNYQVEVDGLKDSFEVVLMHKPSFWDKIPGFPYESIILGLIAAIIIIWRGLPSHYGNAKRLQPERRWING